MLAFLPPDALEEEAMKAKLGRRRAVAWLAATLVLGAVAACKTTSAGRDGAEAEKQAEDRRY